MRSLLRLSLLTTALVWSSLATATEAYPARPVHLVVGSPAGSSPDIVARIVGQSLMERLGQPFVIENRPGAGSNLATEAVVRAAPDGYTLLWVNSASAINATLYGGLSFDFMRDIAPVASIVTVPLVMEVNPAFPAKSVPEFIAYAKAHSGKINMASAGNGTPQHVAGELFKMMTGVDMLHVPYPGVTRALMDLVGGRVDVLFDAIPASLALIRTNKLRPLAVTGAAPSEALPDVPLMSQFVPGYEASSWFGIGAPKETPNGVVEKLNKEINAALAEPQMRARLVELGGAPLAMSPAGFQTFIADETAKWGRVVKFSGAKPQ